MEPVPVPSSPSIPAVPVDTFTNNIVEQFNKVKAEGKEVEKRAWDIVTSQPNGKDVLKAAAIYKTTFHISNSSPLKFEFSDREIVEVPEFFREALIKDSKTLKDLIEDTGADAIPLTQITSTQFNAILHKLYPDREEWKNVNIDQLDLMEVANYLDTSELLPKLTDTLKKTIKNNNLEENLNLYSKINNSSLKTTGFIKEIITNEFANAFGDALAKESDSKRNEMVEKFNQHKISALTFDNPPDINKLIVSIQPIQSLTYLDVTGCSQLTDAAIKDVPRSLTHLNVSFCGRLTDSSVKDVPRSLTHLDAAYTNLTDAAMKEVPRSLTHLSVFWCENLTDAAIKDVPRNVTDLDVSMCANLTDASIQDLPNSLTIIDIRHTKMSADLVRKHLPNAEINIRSRRT